MTNDFPENYSASLEIKFKNGFKMKKICLDAKGDPENPMTEKEICDKTIRLINSNDSNKVELLIKKIIDTDDTNDHSPITWFNDLQEVI
jgi:2-methylcitrate dehydratase PrpD